MVDLGCACIPVFSDKIIESKTMHFTPGFNFNWGISMSNVPTNKLFSFLNVGAVEKN